MTERSHKGLVQREITVRRGGKSFKQIRWVKGSDNKLEPKKSKEIPKGKGSFKPGDPITFMGKNLKIEKVSESQKTIKLSNGKIYTMDAINKGKNIKKKTIKNLKIDEKKLKKSEIINFNEDGFTFKSQINKPKILINLNKSELSKAVNVGVESGKPGFAFIPQVYDNKKPEDKSVDESSTWMKKVQKDLEKELKQFYGD